jgi:quercetin dioxygenase-like cupin family protein
MERKEPYASQEEFNKRVIRYHDIPTIELRSGAKSHVVSGEKVMVSFVTAEPNSCGPVHYHDYEQVMIVTDGACDIVVEGKLYHLEKGDVIIHPPNVGHGSYISDKGCSAIDIFSPPRQDFVAKLEEVKKSQGK